MLIEYIRIRNIHKLTTIKDGRDKLYFSNVESLSSKLLAIIINMNVRFIEYPN